MSAPAFRYELRATTVHHPFYKRHNRYTGAYEPKIVEGRGIWDREQQDWRVEPGMKSEVRWESVRELNELPPMRAAAVSAKLRKAGHRIAKWNASGMVRGWGDWSAGAHVEQLDNGTIQVSDRVGRWSKQTPERARELVQQYAEALQDAGIPIHMADDGRSFTL
ncbi:MAG TPA: hypothetical protein VIG97_07335 [Luteimonas sp.]